MLFRIKFIISVVLFLIGIVTISFDTIPCRASVKGSEPPVFSLDVKNQPLEKVLDKVSKMTGYEITVNKEVLDLPVTASFKNMSVYEGLRRILGSLNHSVISNDKEKKISIVVVTKDIQRKTKAASSGQKEIDPKQKFVTPPSSSGRGLTRGELEALLKANRQRTYSKNDIVTPPSSSGRGLTRGELEALLEANR
jgi:predicted ribonuclease YlaK